MKIQVKVKTQAKQQKIVETGDGSLLISLKSPPVDGQANQELRELLAAKYQVPKSQIRIKSGLTSRYKWVELVNSDPH